MIDHLIAALVSIWPLALPLLFLPSTNRWRSYVVLTVLTYGVVGILGIPLDLARGITLVVTSDLETIRRIGENFWLVDTSVAIGVSIWALRKYGPTFTRACDAPANNVQKA